MVLSHPERKKILSQIDIAATAKECISRKQEKRIADNNAKQKLQCNSYLLARLLQRIQLIVTAFSTRGTLGHPKFVLSSPQYYILLLAMIQEA